MIVATVVVLCRWDLWLTADDPPERRWSSVQMAGPWGIMEFAYLLLFAAVCLVTAALLVPVRW